jgi:hypothetical protein
MRREAVPQISAVVVVDAGELHNKTPFEVLANPLVTWLISASFDDLKTGGRRNPAETT